MMQWRRSTPASLDTDALLQDSPVFGSLGRVARKFLERELAAMSVPGGQLLFDAGDPSDALYILGSGSLGAFRLLEAGDAPELVSLFASGEMVGAYGLLTRRPRAFAIRALRDSELLRLPREGFDALVKAHPQAALVAAQLALERLDDEQSPPQRALPRTLAILPTDRHVNVGRVAARLRDVLAPYGTCFLMDAETGRDRESGWFAERERDARFVLYVDDGTDDSWRDLCHRQADALLWVADSNRKPPADVPSALFRQPPVRGRQRFLIVQHDDDIVPGAAHAWSQWLGQRVRQHHVRGRCRQRDLERLARLLTRNSTGLVLSGGGARGFAVIGVIRALREAGVRIDAVGGTSIGAIIGAGVALEWDDDHMYDAYRKAFVDGKPLADRTLPLVAFSRGGRTVRLLREAYGEVDIEDLPLDYYCVMSNLSNGHATIRRHGRLWYWLRASSAIPGILPPVLHNGQVYVDGGVINNLPTDIMRDRGLGHVLACDISADDALQARIEEYRLPHLWRVWRQSVRGWRPQLLPILLRSGMVNSELASVDRRHLADGLLRPDVSDIGLLDWAAFDRAIDIGYRHVHQLLEEGRLEVDGRGGWTMRVGHNGANG